jgi:hypothetical protein
MKKSTKREEALERLHEDYRRSKKEKEEDEWIRMQTTGGGAET